MDLAEAIQAIVDRAIQSLGGPVPAVVTGYDGQKARVRCRPVLDRIRYGDLEAEAPELVDVPVVWPLGGRGGLTAPLQDGDVVYLVPAAWDLDRWLAGGVGSTTSRKWDLSDSVAIPAVHRGGVGSTEYASDGPVLSGDRIYLGGSDATDWVALAGLVLSELQKIQADLQSLATWASSHVHTNVTPSSKPSDVSGPPQTGWTSGYVPTEPKSSVVKCK